MKLLIRDNRIIGEAGDDYTGPEVFLPAPPDFHKYRPSDYKIENGKVVLDIYGVVVHLTQVRLDTFAQTRGYDGILSAATYATSTVSQFQTEGLRCVELRDSTWAKLYAILAEIKAGTRPTPNSFEEIEPELPVMEWAPASPPPPV